MPFWEDDILYLDDTTGLDHRLVEMLCYVHEQKNKSIIMTAFQNTQEESERRILLHLLSGTELYPAVTQRTLAGNLNMGLRFKIQYFELIKRFVIKGWIKYSHALFKKEIYPNYLITIPLRGITRPTMDGVL